MKEVPKCGIIRLSNFLFWERQSTKWNEMIVSNVGVSNKKIKKIKIVKKLNLILKSIGNATKKKKLKKEKKVIKTETLD